MRGRRFVLASLAGTAAVLLVGYLVAVAAGWDALDARELDEANAAVAVAAVVVLALDAFVPVPASLVMVAVGAAFPLPAALGIAFAGRTAMSLICYVSGRLGHRLTAQFTSAEDRRGARRLLDHHGVYAILLSRPVPIVGESVLFVAGLSRMAARKALAAAALASAAEASAYVLLGSLATGFHAAAALWLVLVALAGAAAWAGTRRGRHEASRSGRPQ